MRYPFVLFCRDASYADVDDVIQKYKDENKFFCSLFIIDPNNKESLRLLYDANYHFLITYGNTFDEYRDRILDVIDESMLCRHKHMNLDCLLNIEQFNQTMNTFYIQICLLPREKIRPVFSLFTTSFNSYDKIFRVYNSLLVQTLKSWEWVIVDDSPDIKHFEWLLKKFDKDPRIRIYRRSKNNGSIGNVKNESIGLCRGNYVLEMDHDDEILPYTLKMAADEFDKDPELGFVYMDFVCLYETDGNNQFYGDFICKGYGGYYSEKINGRWRLVYSTPNINNITMSHLVCCPNHPRMWRRDTLLALGSYCEYLPICDDYEIILRSSVGTKCAKIHKTGYF